nr:hypothetical protein [Deltaproteobacteria bacterium]
MSTLQKTLHPDEKIKAGKLGKKLVVAGLGIAVLFLGLSIIFTLITGTANSGHASKWSRFLHSYVIGWSYIFSLSVGMLWLIILHFLVRGRWVTAVRRICEAMATAMPIIFIAGLGFIIPLLAGYEDLYYWAHPHAKTDHHLAFKLGWLSSEFFAARFVIYGIGFTALAAYFAKKSRQQDETGDPKISETLRIASGPAMILFAVLT